MPTLRHQPWQIFSATQACRKDTDITQECLDHIAARKMMADADWILLSTDNHSSRLSCQTTALEFGIPLISAGVNISVAENKVSDMSGEVITIRLGDNFCLSCLGRINFARIASESHPEQAVREATLARGYVEGIHIKEPAVKTLNTIIGTLAVETLVDQYTKPSGHVPILVYENNGSRRIYEDRESLDVRHKECSLCHVW